MKLVKLNESISLPDVQTIYGTKNANYIYLLLQEMFAYGIKESNQIAYVLATAKHETGGFSDLYENGNKEYFKKYDGRLGNELGTEDWYTYRGRGFVQITGKDNYDRMGKILGLDLVTNPDLAAAANIAAEITVYGMLHGTFTQGKTLNYYINDSKNDYYNARSIINGDKNVIPRDETVSIGQKIAGYAEDYDTAFETALHTLKISYTIDARTETIGQTLASGLGNDKLIGGTGNDILDGAAGRDTASYAHVTVSGINVVMTGTNGTVKIGAETDTLKSIEIIEGTAQVDVFKGGNGQVTFAGGAGGDIYDLSGGKILIREKASDTGRDSVVMLPVAVKDFPIFSCGRVGECCIYSIKCIELVFSCKYNMLT